MSLDDPDCVVNDVLAFQALELQMDVDVKRVIRACLHTSQHLKILAQEGVA